MNEPKWNGRRIVDMDRWHLTNTIRWIEKKWWEMDAGSPADTASEYPDLVEEATNRGMMDADYEPQKNVLGI